MKIKHFKAEKVHGYLSYDINFREDLTFLIGLNGSGKTTVLKLISGLLTPNYLYLAKIKFSKIELTLYDERKDNKICVITATQNEDNFQLFIDEDKIGKYPTLSPNKISDDFESYVVEKNIEKFDCSDYAKKIKEFIESPIILGLDRLGTDSTKIEPEIFDELYYRSRYLHQKKFKEYDGIDRALKKIEDKLHDKVRENAEKKDKISIEIKTEAINELIKLENKLENDNSIKDNYNIESQSELEKLKKNRETIGNMIPVLKIPNLEESCDEIFDKQENVINELSNEKSLGIKTLLVIKYMMFDSKIDSINKIIRIWNKFSGDIEELDMPFESLKKSLNLFFVETNKEVDISGKGDLEIRIKDTDVSNNIYELSSGEKQLIILFSQLAFAQDSKNDIFIVDEPELSLHLAWQENFVKALQEACPKMQFILATHAPAIVNEKSRLGNCVNLSKQ